MDAATIAKLVILGMVLIAAAVAMLDYWGVLAIFGAIRALLTERRAERLAAEARRELAERRAEEG